MGFQSTPSARRATARKDLRALARQISIHALREESDVVETIIAIVRGISIHALREESDTIPYTNTGMVIISIHALREESDHPVVVK